MLVVPGASSPACPRCPFFVLGGGAGFGAYMMLRKREGRRAASSTRTAAARPTQPRTARPAPAEPAPKEPINPDSELFIPVVTPIVLEVSDALVPFVDSRQDSGRFLYELIPFMRDGLFVELGVRFPGVRARGNPGLPPGRVPDSDQRGAGGHRPGHARATSWSTTPSTG